MKICILGCGAYGSALATVLNENNNVFMWTPFEEEAKELNKSRIPKTLPNVKLDKKINISNDIKQATNKADFILLATPVEFIRETLNKVKEYIKDKPIIIASKGIEQNSSLFINQIVENIIKTDNIAVISGPSFAIDVANKVPVGVTLASKNIKTTNLVIKAFDNSHFKLEITEDIIGTEICGSIKNIIAIASGMIKGMKLPESTEALLITKSIKDIQKLIIDLGGNKETILSLAGIGDLILTTTSPKSRNYSLGLLIGSNKEEEIKNYINNNTVEGLYTLKSIYNLIQKENIDIPLINLINDIINKKKKPYDLINFLIN